MTPDWLLRGEPRPVQLEALRRSYIGVALLENQDDDNTKPRRLYDSEGAPRRGPRRGWAHFLEQRLGKTPALLNEYALLRRDHNIEWAIVISPNSFKPEWVAEADRWGVDVPFHEFRSDDRRAAERFLVNNRRFGGGLVINYQALLSEGTRKLIASILGPKTLLVSDESINIKNHSASTSKYAIQIAKECGTRRVLTGKPVTQGPHDLWSQFRFIGDLSGLNYYAFRNTFCKMGGFEGRQVKGAKNEERLQEIMAACAFSARRIDWMKTPGRDYAPRRLEMIPEQKVHYKRMEDDFITDLQGTDVVISADQVVTKILKLQQISSGFMIDELGQPHDIMPPSKNPMITELQDMLHNEISGKTIIFAHYTHTIDMLMEALAEFNPALIAGNGQMKRYGRDIQIEKSRFNSDPACRIIIGQEKAIKYGHTLVGTPDDPALTEIFAENSYSLDDRSQCEERSQGATQVGTITIWDFIPSPILKAAILSLQRKEDVSASVMGYARSTGILPGDIYK